MANARISVAPYVGAWIETFPTVGTRLAVGSHPTWVRGLKLKLLECNSHIVCVAPYVGAWIETSGIGVWLFGTSVAPYVGAWIETRKRLRYWCTSTSRTLRGCVD